MREDIGLLARHFWARALARTGGRATLSPETVHALQRYDWPGNVRELQNVIAALEVRAPRRGSVGLVSLPAAIRERQTTRTMTLDEARRTFERQLVRAAMLRAGGRLSVAARELCITRQGLAKLIKRLELYTLPCAPAGSAERA